MTCQSCGGAASTRPALCDECRAEREAHGRVKGAHRAELLEQRKPRTRHDRMWSL